MLLHEKLKLNVMNTADFLMNGPSHKSLIRNIYASVVVQTKTCIPSIKVLNIQWREYRQVKRLYECNCMWNVAEEIVGILLLLFQYLETGFDTLDVCYWKTNEK